MKLNRENNIYTIIYSAILVLVVGVVLSMVYQALRPAQLENMADDKKRQILAAALITPSPGENISELYNNHIAQSMVINSHGYEVKDSTDAFDINVATEIKKPAAKRKLPIFECKTDNGIKYIIPVYGAGLWGPIWGYVAMNADGISIYGAYFAHQGETPGLGAEIERPAFQEQFRGDTIYDDGHFESVKVVKHGQEPTSGSFVYAISGGTITSQGVQKMLRNSMEPYDTFFQNLQKAYRP